MHKTMFSLLAVVAGATAKSQCAGAVDYNYVQFYLYSDPYCLDYIGTGCVPVNGYEDYNNGNGIVGVQYSGIYKTAKENVESFSFQLENANAQLSGPIHISATKGSGCYDYSGGVVIVEITTDDFVNN